MILHFITTKPPSPSQYLKILRHPNITRYLSDVSTETDSYLVTESCHPLFLLLEDMDANEICSGLHDIAHAINFLHGQVRVICWIYLIACLFYC